MHFVFRHVSLRDGGKGRKVGGRGQRMYWQYALGPHEVKASVQPSPRRVCLPPLLLHSAPSLSLLSVSKQRLCLEPRSPALAPVSGVTLCK